MKKLRFIICLAVFLFLLSSAFWCFRFRNSVVIKADDSTLLNTAPLFRQDNEAWASDFLGSSSYTMKSSGCLTSCIASAISAETGKTITPGELNEIFSANNVYDREGNIQWSQIEKLSYSVQVSPSVSAAEIYSYVKDGHYPIARVRVNGFGNCHYVLITGIENGNYICMDPLKDQPARLSDYWNRVYAVRVVY